MTQWKDLPIEIQYLIMTYYYSIYKRKVLDEIKDYYKFIREHKQKRSWFYRLPSEYYDHFIDVPHRFPDYKVYPNLRHSLFTYECYQVQQKQRKILKIK